jgi:hypothetical protein
MGAKAALAWIFLVALTAAVANSKCGTGNAPSYNDIDAVMFTQNGCKGTIHDANVGTLKSSQFPRGLVSAFDCSAFWASFWNNGRESVPTIYSQYNLKDEVGLFALSATLDDVKALLKKDQFYDLSPSGLTITDTARAVLSVRRCAVITRISVFNMEGSPVTQDAPTLTLFDDLRTLIAGAAKKRISDTPKDFELTGLFDP